MSGLKKTVGTINYRLGWDTHCRNALAARKLQPLLAPSRAEQFLVDVGSGDFGLHAFLPGHAVVGVDHTFARPHRPFIAGDIVRLPFADRALPVVACVDVIEHLSPGSRSHALAELLRVANRAIVLTFPQGEPARRCDERYRAAIESSGGEVPQWLREHQSHEYPDTDLIRKELQSSRERSGRRFEMEMFYSEPVRISSFVRATSPVSPILYSLVNVGAGLLTPLLGTPKPEEAYRVTFVVRFSEGG